MSTIRRVLPYLRPYRRQLLIGVAALLIGTPLTLFHPLVWMYVTDEVAIKGHTEVLIPAVATMVGVHLVGTALSALHRNMLEKVGQQFVADLRTAVYEKLQRQSIAYLDGHRTGDLLARAMNDIDSMQDAIIAGIDQVLVALLRFSVVATAVVMIHPFVGGFTILPIILVWLAVRLFNRRVKALYRGVRDRLGDVSAHIQEALAGHRVMKAFARERSMKERFLVATRTYVAQQFRAINARHLFLPSAQFLGFLSSAVMLGLGAWYVVQGTFTLGGLVAYRGYWWQLYSPIDTLATVNELLQRAGAAGSRVFEVLDAPEEVRDAPDAVPLTAVEGRITFERVSFAYPNGEPVLHELSLEVAPGERVALVGSSGAGKTTLLNLVPRFYDPTSGTIRIDGHDLRRLTQASLRRHIGLVLQETFLFHGSVAENIRFGKPEAAESEVIRAAEMANAHEFISSLPKGYDTPVGERGVKLSGGQRQRIAIARAFLVDPPILILDEATSAVEPESEWIIQQSLERLMAGRTTLITSHRLSMVRGADRIITLDQGRIIEMGTHDELLQQGGVYAEMYRLQVGHLQGVSVPRA